MKTPLVLAVSILSALSLNLSAQRSGTHGAIGIAGNAKSSFNRIGIGPLRLRNFSDRANSAYNGSYWGYPGFYGGFGYGGFGGYGYGFGGDGIEDYPASPSVVYVPTAPSEPPQPPPPPPKPIVQVYHWSESGTDSSAVFSIVTSDGMTHYATMAWVQGDRVHFNIPDGGSGQLPLSSVDRKATRAANAEKHLTLPLP